MGELLFDVVVLHGVRRDDGDVSSVNPEFVSQNVEHVDGQMCLSLVPTGGYLDFLVSAFPEIHISCIDEIDWLKMLHFLARLLLRITHKRLVADNEGVFVRIIRHQKVLVDVGREDLHYRLVHSILDFESRAEVLVVLVHVHELFEETLEGLFGL